MQRLLSLSLIAVVVLCSSGLHTPALSQDVLGAGSTFVYPVLSKWMEAYKAETGVKISYQAVGSGTGIWQVKSRTADFGASDAPLRPEELSAAGLVQFPIVGGGVVPVVNLEGIRPGQLRLSGAVLADIFLGKITRWNAKAISDLNPGLVLPDQPIIPIHRVDGSGTTFVFADYLARVHAEWKDRIGVGMSVEFRPGSAPKATMELPGSWLGPRAPSAMLSIPTQSAASLPMWRCRTATGRLFCRAGRRLSRLSQTPIGPALSRPMHRLPIGPGVRLGRLPAQPLCSSTSNSKGARRQSRCSNSLTGHFTPAPSWPRSWNTSRCRRTLFL